MRIRRPVPRGSGFSSRSAFYPLPRPLTTEVMLFIIMALFSHKFLPGTIQLTLEAGVAPLNILGLEDELSGVDFTPRTMLNLVRTQHGPNITQFSTQEFDIQSAFRARLQDIAENRLFISHFTGDPKKTVARLHRIFEEQGHLLEKQQRKATFHLMEDEQGSFLAVPGGYTTATLNTARLSEFTTQGFSSIPGKPLHRLMIAGQDAIAFAKALDSVAGYNVVNHTAQNILPGKTQLAISQPYLVSAKKGVELHLVRGNVGDLAKSLPPELARPSELGSYLLRGTAAEQSALLTRIGVPHATSQLQDILEASPTIAIASNAVNLVATRLKGSSIHASPEAVARVERFKMKESELDPAQKMGVAFALDRSASLNADETGAGKTLMCAISAHLKTPAERKILVTCPPHLIPQWIDKLDRFIPNIKGPDTLPENAHPDWFKRLPVKIQESLGPKWESVRQRFVFLPESALESGLTVSKAAFKLPDTGTRKTAAKNALTELKSVLKEPISAVLVDETHEYRNAGAKFAVLEAIASGRARDLSAPIDTVVLATATPVHRDAPDLFPLLRLMGVKKFIRMDVEKFCTDYCQRKVTVDASGHRQYASNATPPYGFGMLKEEKIPEVAKFLDEFMISRTKEELTPTRVRRRFVSSPLPYEPSAKLGISLNGFEQKGKLLTVPGATAEKLNGEAHYIAKLFALAQAKSPQTVSDVRRFLEANPGQKIVVFSQFVKIAEQISAALTTGGMRNHLLTGEGLVRPEGGSVATKQQLVDDFIQDATSRVWVSTIGAGGTGIDGLHKVAKDALVNDTTVVPGTAIQAEGRLWRVEEKPVTPDARPVRIHYQIADHPMDKKLWTCFLERRHEMEFVRAKGMLQGLDSPATLAEKEMRADQFAEKVWGLINEKVQAPPLRDNTYLIAKATGEDIADVEEMLPTMADRDANIGISQEVPRDELFDGVPEFSLPMVDSPAQVKRTPALAAPEV